jgi:hypothetical protein
LAVRLQRIGPLISAMAEEISKRAKGEVDIKEIGTIVKFQGGDGGRVLPPAPPSSAHWIFHRRCAAAGLCRRGTSRRFRGSSVAPYCIGMLTNNHVVANAIGSPAAQPGTLDGEGTGNKAFSDSGDSGSLTR